MANKKEQNVIKDNKSANKASTPKPTAPKKPTLSQRFKALENEHTKVQGQLEVVMTERSDVLEKYTKLTKNYDNVQRKLFTNEIIREQFMEDVDDLVLSYKKSNWFIRVFKAFTVLKSLIKLINYYKEAVKNEA
jgi:predicted nuclease with TOPRIM domain